MWQERFDNESLPVNYFGTRHSLVGEKIFLYLAVSISIYGFVGIQISTQKWLFLTIFGQNWNLKKEQIIDETTWNWFYLKSHMFDINRSRVHTPDPVRSVICFGPGNLDCIRRSEADHNHNFWNFWTGIRTRFKKILEPSQTRKLRSGTPISGIYLGSFMRILTFWPL